MLWLVFFIIRCVYVFLQRSTQHPDEYWQGPEVAYRLVFGCGNSTDSTTWEWRDEFRMRSHFHPLFFAIFYSILKLLGLDYQWLIALGPRLLQGRLGRKVAIYFA